MHRNAKVATGLVALFLLAAVAWWQFGAGPILSEVIDTGAVAAAEAERDRQADTGAALSRTETRQESAEAGAAKAAAKTDAGTGSLLVQVVYGDDGPPAARV